MTWEDRLRECAYTSPSGVRTVLTYEDIEKSISKKTSSYTFPETNGTFVQDLGHSGYRFPLRIWFHGADYDTQANAFEEAIKEKGIGVLETPLYGVKNVIPFGDITRKDNLVTAANQCSYDIVFFETLTGIYPSDQTDPAGEVEKALAEFGTAASKEYEENIPLEPTADNLEARNSLKESLSKVRSAVRNITNTADDVQQSYNDIESSILSTLDTVMNAPGTLAFQTIQLIQSPGRALAGIAANLEANLNLLNSLFTEGSAIGYHTNDLASAATISGSVVGVVNTGFNTRTETILAAEQLQAQFDAFIAWREGEQDRLGLGDTGGMYLTLQNLVALTVGYLVFISFTVKQELILVLDRDRTVIDLCAELYGNVDDDLDFLIVSNNLTGEEIMELPKGKEIKYYA